VDKTTIFNWEAGTASPNLRALAGERNRAIRISDSRFTDPVPGV
jgi:hypothetical protein